MMIYNFKYANIATNLQNHTVVQTKSITYVHTQFTVLIDDYCFIYYIFLFISYKHSFPVCFAVFFAIALYGDERSFVDQTS